MTLTDRLADYWKWPIAGAVGLILGIGTVTGFRPDPGDPADLRRIYSAPPADWPAAWRDRDAVQQDLAPARLPPRPEPATPEAQSVALGERLFNDPRLSASGQVACQSCHNRQLGWGDGLQHSFGHGRAEGKRNALPLFASARRPLLFWDGRAASLREQVTGPLVAANEMANSDLAAIPGRLEGDDAYQQLFRGAFGSDAISLDRIASALAAFETQLDRPTPLDRFLQGDETALNQQELEGLHLFRTKARCINCHSGPELSDGGLHNIGLSYLGRPLEDLGRYDVTGAPEDAGKFLTPSLRHVARTAPYMHNGLFPTLEGVVNLYAGGGGRSTSASDSPLYGPASTVSPHLRKLDLNARERAALVAFLGAI